jgi:flavin-dependent dehydrogenase
MLDVAIVGGGPAGSTVGSLLKKYSPRLNVSIFERERFPRDHVGESLLPIIGQVLDEMGCWDKIEAANFPIKVGATYRWGRTKDLWDFHFLENGNMAPEARPGKYEGQRCRTAFQVDRSMYDKILLDHAASCGCEVFEETAVTTVEADGDVIAGLTLTDGSNVQAKWYIDASGHSGLLRRSLGVTTDCPTSLRNIAIWDYWQNAEWMESVGVGGTRIVVASLGYGWLWFIPLGPTRTSIGLVVPAAYYISSGLRPESLYEKAISDEPLVEKLTTRATRENKLSSTRDWSFVADRMTGPNWFLVGESAGFADPILSAGLSLAHIGARDVAYAILATMRGDYEQQWLTNWYEEKTRKAISQHIRFADFWYSSNGCFTDLIDYTAEIAHDAGLSLLPDEAWQWLGTGGFVDHNTVGAGFGGYSLRLAKQISGSFLGTGPRYLAGGKNHFQLNLEGAEKDWGAGLANGRLTRHRAFRRGTKILPSVRLFRLIMEVTREGASASDIWTALMEKARSSRMDPQTTSRLVNDAFDVIEAMIADGWLTATEIAGQPALEAPPEDFRIVGPRTAPAE